MILLNDSEKNSRPNLDMINLSSYNSIRSYIRNSVFAGTRIPHAPLPKLNRADWTVKHSIERGDIRDNESVKQILKRSYEPPNQNENNFSIPRVEIDSMESW